MLDINKCQQLLYKVKNTMFVYIFTVQLDWTKNNGTFFKWMMILRVFPVHFRQKFSLYHMVNGWRKCRIEFILTHEINNRGLLASRMFSLGKRSYSQGLHFVVLFIELKTSYCISIFLLLAIFAGTWWMLNRGFNSSCLTTFSLGVLLSFLYLAIGLLLVSRFCFLLFFE